MPMGNPEELIKEIHQLRKEIDAVIQKTGSYKTKPNEEVRLIGQVQIQREISLVYTKLQEAKMWAGKCLKELY
jgi:hypothetical protein